MPISSCVPNLYKPNVGRDDPGAPVHVTNSTTDMLPNGAPGRRALRDMAVLRSPRANTVRPYEFKTHHNTKSATWKECA